ncbi:MAG: hypothetical protein IJ748_00345 [Bacteroidales bacterium]|nr:hypothetical protein [Bacteroidales bacterium]
MKASLRHILFLLLFSVSFSAFSQEADLSDYAFLNLKADTLVHSQSGGKNLRAFKSKFRKMLTEGRTQVNILHFGDFNLQSDVLPEQMRKNFRSLLPGLDGAKGMLTAVKKTPSAYSLNFSSKWQYEDISSNKDFQNKGLWASSVYTAADKENVSVKINGKNSVKYDFNSFRVYHSALSAGDKLIIDDMNVAYQRIDNPEEGYTEFVLSDYVEQIKLMISKTSEGNFYIYGFYFQNGDAGVVYNVSSHENAEYVYYNNNAALLSSQLASLDADLVILSLGANDIYDDGGETSFETNLPLFIDRIRAVKTDVPIIITTPAEYCLKNRKPNPRLQKSIKTVYAVAEQKNCSVLDFYKIMGGENSFRTLQSKSLLQNDLFKMTDKGYRLMGDLLYNAIWHEVEREPFFE